MKYRLYESEIEQITLDILKKLDFSKKRYNITPYFINVLTISKKYLCHKCRNNFENKLLIKETNYV